MATFRTVASNIELYAKQLFDDREIPFGQILFWVIEAGDRLRLLHEAKRSSGAFEYWYVVNIETDPTKFDHLYITLPARIYDMDMDGAVRNISYHIENNCGPDFLRVDFVRTTRSGAHIRNGKPDEVWSPRNPGYYRLNNRLYLLGVDPDVQQLEITLKTTLPDVTDPNVVDREMDFPPETLLILEQYVLANVRYALGLAPVKLKNDGTERGNQPQQILNADKTTSVNSPVLNPDA